MNREIKVGDEVLIEQCWEDNNGQHHDEYVTISRILPDGTLKFRIGHWKTRKQSDQKKQAWLNQMEWYAKDVTKQ
jgi:hypothetical protein